MRWMWIDHLVEYEPHRRLVTIKNVTRAEEYLHDHLPESDHHAAVPVMPASLMIEGMAQTAGILVGLANQLREKVILAKVVIARFEEDVFPGETIRYDATIAHLDAMGAATSGLVQRLAHPECTWRDIGRVDLIFSHVDSARTALDLPEENFVFTEQFKSLLREYGLLDDETHDTSPSGRGRRAQRAG